MMVRPKGEAIARFEARTVCTPCRGRTPEQREERRRAYRQANADRAREYSAAYRAENREALRAQKREYYRTHKSTVLEYMADYTARNHAAILAKKLAYRLANPDLVKARNKAYRNGPHREKVLEKKRAEARNLSPEAKARKAARDLANYRAKKKVKS